MCNTAWKCIFAVVALCLITGSSAGAGDLRDKLVIPDADVMQRLTLDDGSTLVGRITKVGENEVDFKTDVGKVTIAIAKIKDIKEMSVSAMKGGQYWFPNPNRTRLLVGPTARNLKAGEGYFVDLWVFFPGIAYGVTDYFTIGGGLSIIPGLDHQLFYLTPKVGYSATEMIDVALSVMIFRIWDETAYMGLCNVTYGTDDVSLTLGLGAAWNDNGMSDNPAATLGGEYRVGRRVALVGESWYIPGDKDSGALLLGGLRLLGENMTIDIGIGTSIEDEEEVSPGTDPQFKVEDEISWIPYVDFVWSF